MSRSPVLFSGAVEAELAFPAPAVWKALTSVEGIRGWKPSETIELDFRVGGAIVATYLVDGRVCTERWEFTEIVPNERFALHWAGWSESHIVFALAPDGEHTRLSITQSANGRSGRGMPAARRMGVDAREHRVVPGDRIHHDDWERRSAIHEH